jgi:hypothetical protein
MWDLRTVTVRVLWVYPVIFIPPILSSHLYVTRGLDNELSGTAITQRYILTPPRENRKFLRQFQI